MANVPIPSLPAAISLTGTEQVEGVQPPGADGTSVRFTTQQIADLASPSPMPTPSVGNALNYVRINSGGTGWEARTPAQVTTDITFVADGAAAIARTAQAKMRDWVSVKDFGAVGDGVTDDTAAVQAAFTWAASNGSGCILFPPGNYACLQVSATGSSIEVMGLGGARMTYNGSNTGHNLLSLRGSKCTVTGMQFDGAVYSAFGDTIYPATLLRLEASNPSTTEVTDSLVEGCRFNGGDTSLTPRNVSRCIVRDCFFYRPYTTAIGALDGQDFYFLLNNVIRQGGTGSAIRIGSTLGVNPVASVIIEANTISGCGVLNPSEAAWQEAIDCFSDAESFVRVAGNVIRGGCGGIELKAREGGLITDYYKYIVVENNVIEVPQTDFSAIALNWASSPVPATPDLARWVTVRNNTLVCTETPTDSDSSGIVVNAYTDVQVTGNTITGFWVGVNLNGSGSSDDTIRRPNVVGNTIRDVDIGISGGGTIEGGLIAGNDITATHYGIQLTGTLDGLAIRDNPHIEATAGSGNSYAIQVRNATDVVIEGNHLASRLECIYDPSGSSTGNIARLNTLVSTEEDGARLDSGTWLFALNTIDKVSTKRGNNSGGTVTAYGNNCGAAAVAPTGAGAVGDMVWSTAPAAGNFAWVCSVAGDSGGATWVDV